MADKTGCTKEDADRNLSALIGIISNTLEMGGKITLSGFGIFEVHERAKRNGRNPGTGQTLKIKAVRIPAFRADAAFKAVVNQL